MSVSSQMRLSVGRQLAIDAATAEVVGEFTQRGIGSILLKGAAIAARLYTSPAERSYVDIDLLVAPESVSAAQVALRSLGFVELLANARARERHPHASPWQRSHPTDITVDLHGSIHWCSEVPDSVWRELNGQTRSIELAGTPVRVLRDPALALVIVTHAAEDGRSPKPLEDLQRALVEIGADAWREAAVMASRLGIGAAFESGLRRVAIGAELADELGLRSSASPRMRLLAAGAPPVSTGVLAIVEADGLRERLAVGVSRVFPSSAFIRTISPLARRGRSGLVLAYLHRPLWLALRLPAGVRAWRRASSDRPEPAGRVSRTVSRIRGLTPDNLRGAMWAWHASGCVRGQLRRGGLEALAAPLPPTRAMSGERGVRAVLARRRLSCLERAAVRQCWHAAHGSRRDLVIGVRTDGGFGAHAWLDGDPERAIAGHEQLLRWPA